MNRLWQRFDTAVFFWSRGPRSTMRPLMICLCGLLLLLPTAAAVAWERADASGALLGGYGQSLPGWGQTSERVQTLDLVPRYRHLAFDGLGSGWLRGAHSVLIELPVHLVTSPDVSAMVGLNFLACYTFTADQHWQPYLFGGGGPVYSFADIPGMGARWNGNYQFGLGLEHPLAATRSLLMELRYHHISNGGTEDPNDPLNSIKFLVGFTF